jgi:adenine-specific DNA-methyltransferase
MNHALSRWERDRVRGVVEIVKTSMLKQSPKTTRIARNLRKRESWGEGLIWSWLRDQRFSNYKFRRQHPMGPYFLDFFCNEAKLNIEVDGFQHGMPDHLRIDAERDSFLESKGIKVLRFWSSQLKKDKEMIRNAIWRTLQERTPHPLPNYCRPGIVGEGRSA